MWTHEITATGRDRLLNVYVRFTDGTRSVDQVFSLGQPTPDNWLKPLIVAELDRLNALDANEAAIVKGQIDLTPVPVEPPSADELARQQLARDKMTLSELAREIDLGIRKPDDATYVALKASISAAIDAKG